MNTCRMLHLKSTAWEVGDILRYGQQIGEYGSSGAADGEHLHADCVKGSYDNYSMGDIENGKIEPDKEALYRMMNNTLFNGPYRITTRYLEVGYKAMYGHNLYEHWALDAVKLEGNDNRIYWPMHCPGKVVYKGNSKSAGLYLMIQFTDDITGHHAELGVKALIESGRMEGFPDGLFRPDAHLTRGDYALAEYRKRYK